MLPKPGVGDHEPPVVEHEVADELVDEVRDSGAELLRLRLELPEALGQAVRDPDVAPAQLPHELDVVVPGHPERSPGLDHRHREAQHGRGCRPAIDEVAEEDDLPAIRMPRDRPVARTLVAEPIEQLDQLLETAVHVADQVERAVIVLSVHPERHPLDRRGLHVLRGLERVDVAEALTREPPKGAPELGNLAPHHVAPEVALRARLIARLAHPRREVQDDRDRDHVELAGQLDERPARIRLHVRRVDDREAPRRETLAGDEVQRVEGILRRALIVRIV